MASELPKPGIYQHAKTGRLYRVHFCAKHSETREDVVVYEALYPNDLATFWVRPAAMFQEPVEIAGQPRRRFEFLRDA